MKTLRLIPFLILAACAAPKATVVEEPKKKESAPTVTEAPVLPKTDEADQLRLPGDILGKLPEANQFQATNPNLTRTGPGEGAPVIAKPPAESPR